MVSAEHGDERAAQRHAGEAAGDDGAAGIGDDGEAATAQGTGGNGLVEDRLELDGGCILIRRLAAGIHRDEAGDEVDVAGSGGQRIAARIERQEHGAADESAKEDDEQAWHRQPEPGLGRDQATISGIRPVSLELRRVPVPMTTSGRIQSTIPDVFSVN
jgi:hypothetical protein